MIRFAMRQSGAGILGALTFVLLLSAPAKAQIAWDAPLYVGSESPAGWGLYLVDAARGSGVGILSTFRSQDGPGLGWRILLGEDRSKKLAVAGGADFSGMLIKHRDDFPVDLFWVTGAGLGIGEAVLISVPIGLGVARTLEADGVSFHPYLTPRVILDAPLGGDEDNEMALRFGVDLGVDLSFDPGWAFRFGATIGDRTATAIGISFRVF
jgi:hypothetical protein